MCGSIKNYMLAGAFLGAAILTHLVPKEYECYPKKIDYSMAFPEKDFAEECLKSRDLKNQLIDPIPSECRVVNVTASVYQRFFRDDLCNVSILMECCTSPLFATASAIIVGGALGGLSGLVIGIVRNCIF